MPDSDSILTLHPISSLATGERQPALRLAPPGPFVVGRSSEVEWTIPDQAVSRRHAMIALHAGRWFISDLESRHGTMVNGKPVTPGDRFPLEAGDLVQFGVWSCRCQSPRGHGNATTTFEDRPRVGTQVAAVQAADMAGLAQLRLDALLTVSREFNSAANAEAVATATVRAVQTATGCGRVMVVKQVTTDEFETLASTATEPPRLSRSLIEAAAAEMGLVELRAAGDGGGGQQAHSILDLKIRTAICAPIIVGKSPEAFLYLDTRDTEKALPRDASAFCQSVAQMAGLALERIRSAELAQRHAQLESDLGAARRAQELLMPPRSGTVGAAEYAYESLPGRVVAGDLFDVFPLSAARTAVLLGDVTGKGVGAAVLMAATQSQLRTQILSGKPFARAIEAVSHDLNRHSEVNKFVTMIAAIIDAEHHTIELVDAGHGFAVHATPDAGPIKLQPPTGFPLGVIESAEYESQTFPFAPARSWWSSPTAWSSSPTSPANSSATTRRWASSRGPTPRPRSPRPSSPPCRRTRRRAWPTTSPSPPSGWARDEAAAPCPDPTARSGIIAPPMSPEPDSTGRASTAGAVVSGAYLGDKMSPLSDMTNICAIDAGARLYDHVRHMLYTGLPSRPSSAPCSRAYGPSSGSSPRPWPRAWS